MAENGTVVALSCIGAATLVLAAATYLLSKRDQRIHSTDDAGPRDDGVRTEDLNPAVQRHVGRTRARARPRPRLHSHPHPHPYLRSTQSLANVHFMTDRDEVTNQIWASRRWSSSIINESRRDLEDPILIHSTTRTPSGSTEKRHVCTDDYLLANDDDERAIGTVGGHGHGHVEVDCCEGGRGDSTWSTVGGSGTSDVQAVVNGGDKTVLMLPGALTEPDSATNTLDSSLWVDESAGLGCDSCRRRRSSSSSSSYYVGSPKQSRDLVWDIPREGYMQSLSSLLGDCTLMDMCILGTHDSLTYDLSCNLSKHDLLPGVVASMGNKLLSHRTLHYLRNMGRTQVLTVTEQFQAGVRFFDVRATLKGREWFSVHSFDSRCVLRKYLDELRKVVETNPGEVCVVAISRHGATGKGSGTPLDRLPHLDLLWRDLTQHLGSLLVDHGSLPMKSTTILQYAKAGSRILLYIDGWEKISKGDPRGGHTSDLVHVGIMSSDLHDVRGNAANVRRCFEDRCDQNSRSGRYCYVGLNSANTTSEIIKTVFRKGSLLEHLISKSISPKLDRKLVDCGAHPATLLSFAQMSLYYMQDPLMTVLDTIDQGTEARLPNSVHSDGVTANGEVRVGWLGLGVEHDIRNSAKIGIDQMSSSSYVTGYPLTLDVVKSGPKLAVHLGRDMTATCFDSSCKSKGTGDAARLTFDMFRLCTAVTLAKLLRSSTRDTDRRRLHDMYRKVRSNVWPSYVDRPAAGLLMDVRKIVA